MGSDQTAANPLLGEAAGHGAATGPSDAALLALLDVAKHLGESNDLDSVLSTVIDAMRDLLAAERATVWVHDQVGGELFTRVAHGLGTGTNEIRIPLNRGVVGAAAQSRAIVEVPDAYADERFDRSVDLKTGFKTRNILAVPLLDDEGELIGVAQVLNRMPSESPARDLLLAQGLASQAAVAVRRARLLEDRITSIRLQEELEVARSIQQGSFPTTLPQIERYQVAARSIPAEECGGDTFDAIPIGVAGIGNPNEPATTVLFMLADATGHGVGPALSSMQARSMVRAAVRFQQPLGRLVNEVNSQLFDDLPRGRFVTAWLGILDTARDEIECFSAGQGPIFVFRAATGLFDPIDSDAPPLGIIAEDFCSGTTQRIHLSVGDILLVLTDGYYEAPDSSGQLLGEEPICSLVREMRAEHPSAMLTRIDEQTLQHAAAAATPDDRTAIVIKRVS